MLDDINACVGVASGADHNQAWLTHVAVGISPALLGILISRLESDSTASSTTPSVEIVRQRQKAIQIRRMAEGMHGHKGSNNPASRTIDTLSCSLLSVVGEVVTQFRRIDT